MELIYPLLANKDVDTEGCLVYRLKARDPQALADLYDIYGRRVYFVIVRIINNPSVAEDLVQETFLKAWNRAAQLDGLHGSAGPWLFAIARHTALDYRKSSQAHLSAWVEMDDNHLPAVMMEEEILVADRVRQLEAAFLRLTPNQKCVIQLAYYGGLSQSDIAERLQQPLGTIKSWTRLALQRLRDAFDRGLPEQD